jgi:DnaJ-class molecular chaperone
MAHAEKCPVCNGKGEIFRAGDVGDTRSNNVCHGCNGKGWVEVGTEYPEPAEYKKPLRKSKS